MQDLHSQACGALASLESLDELLKATSEVATKTAPVESLTAIQKKTLLDSFSVKRFHQNYKEWENNSKSQFVSGQVVAYNQKVARMFQIHSEYEINQAKYNELRRAVRLPELEFSVETIREYKNGELFPKDNASMETDVKATKDASVAGEDKISLSSLFSLSSQSALPEPKLEVIKELVNIEYRSRMKMQIKNEVLLRLKSHLIAKNSQWAGRDAKLNSFLTHDFKKVYDDVMATRASEYEDLKYYDDEIDEMEDEDIELKEEDKEMEMNGEDKEVDMNDEKEAEINEEKEVNMNEEEKDVLNHDKEEEEGYYDGKDKNGKEMTPGELSENQEKSESEHESPQQSVGFVDPDNNDDMLLE